MHIAYYITSHGYGHGVRSCCIAEVIPEDIQITFKTTLPEQLFHEEVSRPFFYSPVEFDCGCVQSDGVTTDIAATLNLYSSIAEKNKGHLTDEVLWCKDNHIDLIVSDITPFAFDIASNAAIRSIAICNFTWYDIYQEYIPYYPSFAPILEDIKRQYSYADIAIALYPPLPMSYFKKINNVPLIGRKGKDVRNNIRGTFKIPDYKKIGLIYVGNFGMDSASWEKLELFKEWEFLGVYPLPGNPANYHLITKDLFRYQDLVASSDVMIAKLGYGSVSECMLNGKPIIYLPRSLFTEYPVLEHAVNQWGYGFKINEKDFCDLQWNDVLGHATEAFPVPIVSDGVKQIVEMIRDS